MTALTASHAETEALTQAKHPECAIEPLTATSEDSQRCGNPFCAEAITIKSQRGKLYCCDHCRMDGYALKRAKALLNRVGVIRFHELMDRL